jgi:tetratricopeptide (TPR) repeat protein
MLRPVFSVIIVALSVLSMFSLDAYFATVQADDASDCRNGQGDTALRGCSAIIKSKRLFGKPISRNNLAMTYHNRAVIYGKSGQYNRAIADFNQAIKLNPKNSQFYYNRGVTYSDKGQHDRAISDYDKAIKLNPKIAGIYNDRGVAYKKKGQYDRAIADYGRALKLNPKYSLAYWNRGLAYEKMGQRRKAIADFRKFLQLRPGNKFGLNALKRLEVANQGNSQNQRTAADDKKICFAFSFDPKKYIKTEVKIRACGRVIDSGLLSGDKLAEVYNQRATFRCLVGDLIGATKDAIEVLSIAAHDSIERDMAEHTINLLISKECA